MTIHVQTQTRPSAFLPCPVPVTLNTKVGRFAGATRTMKTYTLHCNGQDGTPLRIAINEGRYNRLRNQHNKRSRNQPTGSPARLRDGYTTIKL